MYDIYHLRSDLSSYKSIHFSLQKVCILLRLHAYVFESYQHASKIVICWTLVLQQIAAFRVVSVRNALAEFFFAMSLGILIEMSIVYQNIYFKVEQSNL